MKIHVPIVEIISFIFSALLFCFVFAPPVEFEHYEFEKQEARKAELKADEARQKAYENALQSEKLADLQTILKEEASKSTVDDWVTLLAKPVAVGQRQAIEKSFLENIEKATKTAADYQKLVDHFDLWSKHMSEGTRSKVFQEIVKNANDLRERKHNKETYNFTTNITQNEIELFYAQMALCTKFIKNKPEYLANLKPDDFRRFLKSFDIAFNRTNLESFVAKKTAGSTREVEVIGALISALPGLANEFLKNTMQRNDPSTNQEFKTFLKALFEQFASAKDFNTVDKHQKDLMVISAQVLNKLLNDPSFAEFAKNNQPLVDEKTLKNFQNAVRGNEQGFDYLGLKYDLAVNGYQNIDTLLKTNSAVALSLIVDTIDFMLRDLANPSSKNRLQKLKILMQQFQGTTNKFNLEALLQKSTNRAEVIKEYQLTMFKLLENFNNAPQGALISAQVQELRRIIADNLVAAVTRFTKGLENNEFVNNTITESTLTALNTIDTLIKVRGIEETAALTFELLNAAQAASGINKAELLNQSTKLVYKLINEYNILVNPSYETYIQLMKIRGLIDPTFINDPAYKKIRDDEQEKLAEQKQKLEEEKAKEAAEKAKQQQEALIKSLQERSRKALTSDKDRSALLENILTLQNTAPDTVLLLINDFIANNSENITEAQANLLMNSGALLADVKRTIIDQLLQSKLKPDVSLQVISVALQRDNDLNLIFKKLIPFDISRLPNISQLINRRIQNVAMFKAEPLLNEYLKNNPLETLSSSALKNILLIMTATKETEAFTKTLVSTALKEKWSLEQVITRLDAIPEAQAQILVEIIPTMEIKGVDSINNLLRTLQVLKNRAVSQNAKAALTDRQLFIINKLTAKDFETMSEANADNINDRISELMPEVSQLKDIKTAFDISVATLGRIIMATKMRREELEYQKKHPWLYSLQNTFWSFLAKSFDYSKLDKTVNKGTLLRYADEVNKYITENMREFADPDPAVQNKEEKMFTEILNNIDLLKKKLSA